MSNDEDLENQGFKVSDRRRFNADGTPIEGSDSTVEKDSSESEFPKEAESEIKLEENAAADFPISFSGLILSIAAGVQSALGLAPHPLTGKVEKNLSQAKQNIDLLGVLAEKTKGNLELEEEKLLQALLSDLRMQYVEAKKT